MHQLHMFLCCGSSRLLNQIKRYVVNLFHFGLIKETLLSRIFMCLRRISLCLYFCCLWITSMTFASFAFLLCHCWSLTVQIQWHSIFWIFCQFEHLAFYLVELCLVEYEALKYKPSLLCASAIYLARCTMKLTPTWTPLLRKHSRYEESQIRHVFTSVLSVRITLSWSNHFKFECCRSCTDMILKFHKAAKTAMLKVTYEKYMRLDFSRVAAINPLEVLPQCSHEHEYYKSWTVELNFNYFLLNSVNGNWKLEPILCNLVGVENSHDFSPLHCSPLKLPACRWTC